MNQAASKIVSAAISTSRVASALIFGLTPSRTLENTTMGSVVEAGPLVKLATTRSSSDMVNASSQPATSARADDRQGNGEEHLGRTSAQIERRLLHAFVHLRQPRLDDDGHESHREGGMGDGDG